MLRNILFLLFLFSILLDVKSQDTLIFNGETHIVQIVSMTGKFIQFREINSDNFDTKKVPKELVEYYSKYNFRVDHTTNPFEKPVGAKIWEYCTIKSNDRYNIKGQLSYTGIEYGHGSLMRVKKDEEDNSYQYINKFTPRTGLFTTVYEMLNYMGNYGWELIQVHHVDNSNSIHYILKREKLE